LWIVDPRTVTSQLIPLYLQVKVKTVQTEIVSSFWMDDWSGPQVKIPHSCKTNWL